MPSTGKRRIAHLGDGGEVDWARRRARLAALAKKAKAATAGPWEFVECGGFGVVAGPTSENRRGYVRGGRGHVAQMEDLDVSEAKQRANAKFIAAASPQVVADLVDEILRLRTAAK